MKRLATATAATAVVVGCFLTVTGDNRWRGIGIYRGIDERQFVR